MKKPDKWVLYAAYAVVVAGLSLWQYHSYRASFETVQPYSHPGPVAERTVILDDEEAETSSRNKHAATDPSSEDMTGTDESTTEPTEIHFPIDLNTADAAALAQIPGIGEVTAAAIIAYRDEHGGFRNREELLQIHGIGEKRYQELLDYIYLTNEQPLPVEATENTTGTEAKEPTGIRFPVDLNTADAAALAQIPGIGEATAEAIIAYRNEHGGFRNRTELLQIHGIGEKRYQEMLDYVYLTNEQPLPAPEQPTDAPGAEPAEPPVINLNTATKEQLMMLPGCTEELADAILILRDEKIHVFQNTLEIMMATGMEKETDLYYAWAPYLAVDDEGNQSL
ncbi:MAG: helix-hairpin-helix domain-containing protein [Oscillospiraceae bacterium]|nr:helix-hairpin-helix domain-containing protein [Oscillospiraceae bacterium]